MHLSYPELCHDYAYTSTSRLFKDIRLNVKPLYTDIISIMKLLEMLLGVLSVVHSPHRGLTQEYQAVK